MYEMFVMVYLVIKYPKNGLFGEACDVGHMMSRDRCETRESKSVCGNFKTWSSGNQHCSIRNFNFFFIK